MLNQLCTLFLTIFLWEQLCSSTPRVCLFFCLALLIKLFIFFSRWDPDKIPLNQISISASIRSLFIFYEILDWKFELLNQTHSWSSNKWIWTKWMILIIVAKLIMSMPLQGKSKQNCSLFLLSHNLVWLLFLPNFPNFQKRITSNNDGFRKFC